MKNHDMPVDSGELVFDNIILEHFLVLGRFVRSRSGGPFRTGGDGEPLQIDDCGFGGILFRQVLHVKYERTGFLD